LIAIAAAELDRTHTFVLSNESIKYFSLERRETSVRTLAGRTSCSVSTFPVLARVETGARTWKARHLAPHPRANPLRKKSTNH